MGFFQLFFEVSKNKKEVKFDGIEFFGIPFLYEGRIYIARAYYESTISVFEPSLPYRKKSGFRI